MHRQPVVTLYGADWQKRTCDIDDNFAICSCNFSTVATLSTIWRQQQQQQIDKFGKKVPFSIFTDSTDLRGS
jgi:hypothetical protein